MNWVLFLSVLIMCESDGRNGVVGDKHLRNRAYGVCQIRKPYLDDVNRIAGTGITLEQVRYSPGISRWCTYQYLSHYGKRYTRITGKEMTMEVAARIHNGGPNGWQRSSTDVYWEKFKQKRVICERE